MTLLGPFSWDGDSWHIRAVTTLLDVIRERVSTPSLPVNYHTVTAALISYKDIICVIEWGVYYVSPLAVCGKCMGIPETTINYTSVKKLYASVHSISISKHPLGIHIFQLAWRGLRADWPHKRSSMSLLAQGSLSPQPARTGWTELGGSPSAVMNAFRPKSCMECPWL